MDESRSVIHLQLQIDTYAGNLYIADQGAYLLGESGGPLADLTHPIQGPRNCKCLLGSAN